MHPKELTGFLTQLDAQYKRVGLDDTALFGTFQKEIGRKSINGAVCDVQSPYRLQGAHEGNERLHKWKKDVICRIKSMKLIYWNGEKILQRLYSRGSQYLERKVDKLAYKVAELSLLGKK